jgi:hypothetical protein
MSTSVTMESAETLAYITNIKIGDGQFKGTRGEFILHLQDQIKKYESQVLDTNHLSDSFKRTMIDNAVHPVRELRDIKEQAELYAICSGQFLTYDQYGKVIMSTCAFMDHAETLAYIKNIKIGDGQFKGTTKGFILHYQDQIRKYESLVQDTHQVSDSFKCTMLNNAVYPVRELRDIKEQAELCTLCNGKFLTYDQYCDLLMSTCARMESAETWAYITNIKIGDGQFKGTRGAFILHLQDQIQKYELQGPDTSHLPDSFKRTMLENAVYPVRELRDIKVQADLNTLCSGECISYDRYCDVLMSTCAFMERAETLAYITNIKIGDGQFKGTTKGFILHCQDQIRKYESIVLDPNQVSDSHKCTMLEIAVYPMRELRDIKVQAELYAILHGGEVLPYDRYCDLLMSAAQTIDRLNGDRPSAQRTRRILEHDIYHDDYVETSPSR